MTILKDFLARTFLGIRVSALQAQVDSLQDENRRWKQTATDLQHQNQSLTGQLTTAQASAQDLATKLTTAQAAAEDLRAALAVATAATAASDVALKAQIEPLKLDLASLQARVQDLTATLAVLQPQATTDAEKFREGIFDRYGFTQYARAFIRIHSTIEVGAGSTTTGGGGWTPWNHTVRLLSPSHEAAVHELSHVWHHYLRQDDPGTYRYSLVRGLVHFANDRAWAGTELQKFFRVYVYGDPATGFPGMLPGVKDVWNITEEEWDTKVIDAEVYAGIASWCMLKYREGLRALPPEMWGFYERLGGGITEAPAYYEGGPA